MADTNLTLNWDTYDGNIVCTLNVGETPTEVGSMTIDREELIEAFAEDFQEADERSNPELLLDWELLAEQMADLSDTITAAVNALKAKQKAYRNKLLTEGVDWT
jgi:hypothetical protein